MSFRKRAMTVFLVLSLALGLCACGGQSTADTGQTDAPAASSTGESSVFSIPIPEPEQASEPEPTTEPPTTEWQPPTDGSNTVVSGCIVTNSGTDHVRAIEMFGGNDNVGSRYAGALERLQAALGEGTQVWSMVVPTSQAFYTPEEFAAQNGDQNRQQQTIAAAMPTVISVPLYDVLYAHRSEAIYSRTDYHWQPLAAYYAAGAFADAAQVPFSRLETYEAVTREGYVGAFYYVNRISELASAPEDFTYYKPACLDSLACTYYNTDFTNPRSGSLFHEDNGISSSYTIFVGTDECVFSTEYPEAENERVLVIVKDSYGNALVPFLAGSFRRVYLCDFRFFGRDLTSFAQEVGATDVLFAMSTVAVTTAAKVDMVERMIP